MTANADRLTIITFTANGAALGRKIKENFEGFSVKVFYKGSSDEIACDGVERLERAVPELVRELFTEKTPVVFIGAMGIAIRMIADCVKDKLTDSPVLVIDELGSFVIPVLSGHVGGANLLAHDLAELLSAVPVITTATDINGAFSPDLFAKERHLSIVNREGIAKVSKKALEGKVVTLSIKNYPPKEPVDILIADSFADEEALLKLSPKKYVVGIGCRRDKEFESIESHLMSCLAELGIGINDVYAFASIDIKADEEGLKELSRRYRLPFITFDADSLRSAPGEYTASDFVSERVGVDNVCERAAILAGGPGSRLVMKKNPKDGVTVAVALRNIYV